jgi:glucose-6-phosphate isomerase
MKDLLTGGLVNTSEHRPALHTALRNLDKTPVLHLGQDVMPAIVDVWQRIDGLCNKWVGVTDLIHIGIGGSDFGPRLAVQALAHSTNKTNRSMRVHFAANIDSAELSHILERAQANSTKVLIVSKSFSTAETMLNAKTIINWFKSPAIPRQQNHLAFKRRIFSHFGIGWAVAFQYGLRLGCRLPCNMALIPSNNFYRAPTLWISTLLVQPFIKIYPAY